MDRSLSNSSVHGIFLEWVLEWIAILFSRGSSWPRDQTCICCTAGRFFTTQPSGRRRQGQPTPVLLPGKSHGLRSLVGCSPWGCWESSSRARLRDFTFTFHFHALEKEMAPHSSVLAWRIPGMGEPGGLPSMGSQSRTRLKWLSSSSSKPSGKLTSNEIQSQIKYERNICGHYSYIKIIRFSLGWIPGSGRSPGGRHGNPLQYSCQENSMDRGA